MKKAIIITHENKAANKQLFKRNEINTVRVFNELEFPKVFNQISNGYQFRTDLHEQDGFYDVTEVVLDEYQRKIPLVPSDFDAGASVFVEQKEDFTQAEIDQAIQQAEDNDESAQLHQEMESKEQAMLDVSGDTT